MIFCFGVEPTPKMEPIKMKFFSQIALAVSACMPDGLMLQTYSKSTCKLIYFETCGWLD